MDKTQLCPISRQRVRDSLSHKQLDKIIIDFGSESGFWGGYTRNIFNIGTLDDVRRDVLERIEIFYPAGGFVFCPIHGTLPDVPPQNIMAMFKAVSEFNSQR